MRHFDRPFKPQFPGGVTRVPMTSFAPDKVVRQVLIDWHNWKMKIQQVDLVDGYLSEERVIDIPADWYLLLILRSCDN